MIVVVGRPAWRPSDPASPAGRACELALAAAGAGARVELVGRVGDDPHGDALLIALSAAGVGHVALLRDPARPTPTLVLAPVAPGATSGAGEGSGNGTSSLLLDEAEPLVASVAEGGPVLQPADVSLGLSYLTAFGVLVVTDDVPAGVVPVCVEGAGFAEAHLVVLVAEDAPPPPLPEDATVLAVPPFAPGDAVARLVGAYAARLDVGTSPAEAFAAALALEGETAR